MKDLILKISKKTKKNPNIQGFTDWKDVCRELLKTDEQLAIDCLIELSNELEKTILDSRWSDNDIKTLYGLHKQVLLLAAPHHFEAYLLYVESQRDPEKKFYPPRRKVLKEVVDSLQDLADDKLDLLAISLPPGAGKLLSDDTPVMTSDGWKTHGDIKVGDYVVGLDGEYKRVQYVFPKDYAEYEVTFSNGDTIRCHGKHEWVVFNRHTHKWETLETEEIIRQGVDSGIPNTRGHRNHFLLPNPRPMKGIHKDLPVDPYVLGAWLGDGTTAKPMLTICDTDSVILFEVMKTMRYGISRRYKQTGCTAYHLNGLRQDLKKLGMCQRTNAVAKFIPKEYIYASELQRLRLLAGLIDTDGNLSDGKRYMFSTTNPNLAEGVKEIVATFGWRVSETIEPPRVSSSGIAGRKYLHKISFYPKTYIPCKVKRKQMRAFTKQRRISISQIKPIEKVQGNCIQVEGGIYRVGRTMLPTHNSTLAIFYLTWLAGKYPDEPMLTGSHSNSFVRGVYDECLRMLDPTGEYLWHEVFPGVSVSNTNAKDCRIDIGKRKRFETLEFTSIGTGNAGLYRASRLLYCDDLIPSIEVALSKERLDKLWEQYTTDLRQRKIGDHCKELHIATRWSVHDVIGRLEREYGDSDRAKFIVIPALDENDESNFDYAYGVGFNTKFYHEQREIMDDSSWKALYQNTPVEREGLLYAEDELRRYFELPDGEPDAILSVCDTKDRGKDYCAMPIVYQYGNDYYVEKIVCDNSNPEIVETRLVMELLAHKVQMSRFESNSAGGRVAQKVQEQVKAKGGRTKITTKYTTTNKETKILVNSPFIKEHCLFKDDTVIGNDKEYRKAMQFICSYTLAGKNKYDDVVDALAQLSEFIQSLSGNKVSVFQRPF